MKVLSYVAIPHLDESPVSLLMRTAFHNGYETIDHMGRNLKLDARNRKLELLLTDGDMCNLLAAEIPEHASEIHDAFYDQPHRDLSRAVPIKIKSMQVPSIKITSRFRYCPICVEEGYARVQQDIAWITVCPAHNVRYIENCPKCDNWYNWWDATLNTCRCGYEYRFGPRKSGSIEVITSQLSCFNVKSVIEFVAHHQAIKPSASPDSVASAVTSLENEHIAANIYQSIQSAIADEMILYRNLPLSVFEAPWRVLNDKALSPVILNFINNNHVFYAAKCEKSQCCAGVELTFSELTSALQCRKDRTRELINDGVFLHRHCPLSGKLTYSSPHLCQILNSELDSSNKPRGSRTKENTHFKTPGETAKLLNTTIHSVRLLARTGLLEYKFASRKQYFSINSINNFLSTYLLPTELSMSYDLSTRRVSSILKYRKFRTFPAPNIRIYFRSDDFSILNDSKRHKSEKRNHPISLEHASVHFSIATRWLKKILTHLQPATTFPHKKSSENILSQRQLKALEKWSDQNFSVQKVSVELGISTSYIQRNFVQSGMTQPKRFGNYFFSRRDFEIMKATSLDFMTCLEAATILGVRPQQVHRMIDRRIIKTAKKIGLTNGKIQKLLSKKEIHQLLNKSTSNR